MTTKKILIIGGSGLVGGNCYQFFKNQIGWKVLATHLNFSTDYTKFFDPLATRWPSYILETNWDVLIHTASLTHVDRCEQEPDLSYRMTVETTKKLVDFAKTKNAKFIYTSTDYVFDGKKGLYSETCRVNPINVYGKHKLKAEEFIEKELADYLILRFTNVYGDEIRNKNFVSRTLKQLKEAEDIELTGPSDQFATPINAYDIARVIHKLVENRKKGIFHIASSDYYSRIQLIQRIAKYFPEKTIKINPKTTKELQQIAPRPFLGGLLAKKFITAFPDFVFSNLDDYILLKKYGKNQTRFN